jgi:gas vesicle protein
MSILKDLKNINFKSQKQQNKEKNQSMLLGIIVGTAVGTVAGVFMQTDKGKQARKEVVSKAKDISQKSKVVLYDSVNKIKATKDKVVDRVSNKNKEIDYEEKDVAENN